ncbi:MAG: SIR2 family protein [Bacillota bacterium]
MNEVSKKIAKLLKKANSLPYVFVGSGMSRRYLHTDSWEELLRDFAKQAAPDFGEHAFNQYADGRRGKDLEGFPGIASAIERDFNRMWFLKNANSADGKLYAEKFNDVFTPFKLEIARKFCNQTLDTVDLSEPLRAEINCLKKAGEKSIAGIITTNYDNLVEELFPQYQTYIGQSELLFAQTYGFGEIYKIHGCCSRPESVVINENDYEDYNEKQAYLVSKLLTLFVEHPVIFLGYSLNDPNILKILESLAKCLTKQQLAELGERFLFIEYAPGCANTEFVETERAGVKMTAIRTNEFLSVFRGLCEIWSKYPVKILRKLKKDVYELVEDVHNSGVSIQVLNIDDNTDADDIQMVMGVGAFSAMGDVGYGSLKATDLYLDVVFDDKRFDVDKLVEITLPQLLKQNSGSLPVYKYLSESGDGISGLNAIANVRELLSATINKRLLKLSTSADFDELVQNCNDDYCRASAKIVVEIFPEHYDVNKIESFLRLALTEKPGCLFEDPYKTDIKRLIRIYDWLKYAKK